MIQSLQLSPNSQLGLCLAIILLSAFLLTRVTKFLKLPHVTAYIFTGVILGPYCIKIIPSSMIESLGFVTDIALGFIAFGVGRYFLFKELKRNGINIMILTCCESLLTGAILVVTMVFLFHLPLSFALLLGAIGSATAPASTIMTIRQYKAKGEFVNLLLQVVALDDAVSILAFSICAAISQGLVGSGNVSFAVVLQPILTNLAALVMGSICGWIMHKMISDRRSTDNRLIIAVSMILIMGALCGALDVSPLLCCMAIGATYLNLSKDVLLFDQVSEFAPPIMTIFFVVSGMNLNIPALRFVGLIGLGFFFFRIVGKLLGSYVGCYWIQTSTKTRNTFGLALVPSAGVAIGLATLGQRILPDEMGIMLSTIILSTAILYEIVGPLCAKTALFKSGSADPTTIQKKHHHVIQSNSTNDKPVEQC